MNYQLNQETSLSVLSAIVYDDVFQLHQTSQITNSDSVPDGKAIQMDVTQFSNDSVSTSAAASTRGNVKIPTMYVQPDFSSLLSRPYPVSSFYWKGDAPLGSILTTIRLPDVLLSQPFIKDKLANFAFLKANFNLSIQVNGSPGQYGKLVFGIMPFPDAAMTSYFDNLGSLFTSDFVQVDANNAATVNKTLHFINYQDKWQLPRFQGTTITIPSMYQVTVGVAVPLTAVAGLTTDVSVTVFASFTDVEVTGYNLTQTSGKKTEGEEKTERGTISTSSIAKSVVPTNVMESIPVVGPIVNALSQGLEVAGPVLNLFGLSVPPNLSTTNPMQFRNPLPLLAEDCPLTRPAGPNPSVLLNRNFDDVCDTPEALLLTKYVSRPGLLNVYPITQDDKPGKVLAAVYLNVAELFFPYVSTTRPAVFVPTPLSYVARFFEQWRGGIRICISITASVLQTCKLRVCYIPDGFNSSDLSLLETSNLRNDIIDVRGNTEWRTTIQLDQALHWRDCGGLQDFSNSANGSLVIQLVNKLTAYQDVTNPIYMQIFVSGADDMEFALPKTAWSMVPNLSSSELHQTAGYFDASVTTDLLAASSYNLMTMEYPPFFQETNVIYKEDAFSSQITSFRSLTNMASVFRVYTSDPTKCVRISNNANLSTVDVMIAPNFLMSILSMFRFYRGSFRAFILPVLGADSSPAACAFTSYDPPGTPFYSLSTPANQQRYNYYYSSDLTVMPLDQTIPYNCPAKCRLTNPGGKDLNSFRSYSVNLQVDSSDKYEVYLSGGDDLMFGVQMPIPLCVTQKI